MHKTNAGERRKALKRKALELAKDAKNVMKAAKTLPEAMGKARELQSEAAQALAESEDLKALVRLEDLNLWQMEKTRTSMKGSKKYTYWMASWREGVETRNVHLGSCAKMDAKEAMQKAKKMKSEALRIRS
jgi:ParB-like chromosome segregation protein Spo0J